MRAEASNSFVQSLYAQFREWLEQRARRRQSLRQSRLTLRAERKLGRVSSY